MGNICSENKSCSPNIKGRNAPRDLTSLLAEIRDPEDTEKSPWAKKFRGYLKENSPDLEPVFDFVIVTNVLKNKEIELKNSSTVKWKIAEINKERRELLNLVGTTFFSEDSPTPISLSNRVLRESITNELSDLEKDESLSSAFDLVWQARCDFLVWKGGVDSAYQKFLRFETRPVSLVAVLLSIL